MQTHMTATELRQYIVIHFTTYLLDGASVPVAQRCHRLARKLAKLTGESMEQVMAGLQDDSAVMVA